jgi:hypothetical protein
MLVAGADNPTDPALPCSHAERQEKIAHVRQAPGRRSAAVRKVSNALTKGFALRSNRRRFFKAKAL